METLKNGSRVTEKDGGKFPLEVRTRASEAQPWKMRGVTSRFRLKETSQGWRGSKFGVHHVQSSLPERWPRYKSNWDLYISTPSGAQHGVC
jgi:hypothetical protein